MRELKDFPPAKQMEVASFLLDVKSYDKAEKLTGLVKKRPEEPLEELYEEMITEPPRFQQLYTLIGKP